MMSFMRTGRTTVGQHSLVATALECGMRHSFHVVTKADSLPVLAKSVGPKAASLSG